MKHLLHMLLLFVSVRSLCATPLQSVSSEQLLEIADKIYHNEAASRPELLISWNESEQFLSLGIGHFIWFPKNLESRFTESFPDFLDFLQAQNTQLPEWLKLSKDNPWPNKQAFLNAKAQNDVRIDELQTLVLSTFEAQIEFILQRAKLALPKMLETLDNTEQRSLVENNFAHLSKTELGIYSLIDYVNFKGEGTSETEQYKNQGWGLLQVLMHIPNSTTDIHSSFSQACKTVLAQRVENSPPARNEHRWLPGWHKRCDTYKSSIK